MLWLMCFCVWNSLWVWISYRSLWQKLNYILGHKISCKYYPKWNAYTCPSKYWVVLKCSRNETSCKQNFVFTPVWNIKPAWVHFTSHLSVLIITKEDDIITALAQVIWWWLKSHLIFRRVIAAKIIWKTLFSKDFSLRWLVGLKLIWPEQQKTYFSPIILAKNSKIVLFRNMKDKWNTWQWKYMFCAFKFLRQKWRNFT